MRSLVLRIYLALVAVLLLFAVVGGWIVQRHFESERAAARQMVADRASAFADIARAALPAASAAAVEQEGALEELSSRLRVPLALESAEGQRIATATAFADRERMLRHDLGDASERRSEREFARTINRLPLGDGRQLLVWRPPWRMGGGRFGPPGEGAGGMGPPGLGLQGPSLGSGPFGPHLGGPGGFGPHLGGPGGPHDDGLDPPFGRTAGLLLLLTAVFFAVAIAAWPVARRLTRRLERLQAGVEAFGEGALGLRLPEAGRDEVSALARSFNRAAARIEALVGSHRQLLANASHELRSPLARLKMAVSMLEALPAAVPPEQAAALDAQRQKLGREVHANIAELDAMVEEVLLASRLDASVPPAPEQDPVLDWWALVEDEVAMARHDAEGGALAPWDPSPALAPSPASARAAGGEPPASWRLHGPIAGDGVHRPVAVRGDERLLRRAVRNLLQNARRYGGDEAEVRFLRTGGGWALCVDDRGPGVPPAWSERIFEPFFRLPGHAESSGGVGLGLSLVRQIAVRHRGAAACCARTDGPGSRFCIELPAAG